MDYIVCGILQARILEWVDFLQGIFPTQGSIPVSPTSQADSLPAELEARFLFTPVVNAQADLCPVKIHTWKL